MKRYERLLELLVGKWQPSLAVALAKFVLGVVCPVMIGTYAMSCIGAREAVILARGGLIHVQGLPAVAVGIAYACVAGLLYVQVCWENHPHFSGLRDFARQILLLVIAILLAGTLALALL